MNRKRAKESVWLGTAQIGNMQFVAISTDKPKPPKFATASLSFHSILAKDLDALYKIAKRTVLRTQRPIKAPK
jgi:hypothetical protein